VKNLLTKQKEFRIITIHEIIDIDFRDRGIVEYFIELLLNQEVAYNIKIRVSKDERIRKRTINRLKKILIK
jgi:hypothetical protein